MPAATSLDPLYDRIYEVLVDGAGTTLALPSANRFRLGTFPGQPLKTSGIRAHEGKRAWVSITSAEPEPTRENANVAVYRIRIRIDLSYYSDHEADHLAQRGVMALAGLDMHRIRRALGAPGNLSTTAAGSDTGLASGALVFESWSAAEPLPDARLLRVSAFFAGYLLLTDEPESEPLTTESGLVLTTESGLPLLTG